MCMDNTATVGGAVRVSRSGEENSSAGAAGGTAVCLCVSVGRPPTHLSILCPFIIFLPLRQSDCRRCLCLPVRIWYLKPRPPALPPPPLADHSRKCLSSLLPPTDHNIHYDIYNFQYCVGEELNH